MQMDPSLWDFWNVSSFIWSSGLLSDSGRVWEFVLIMRLIHNHTSTALILYFILFVSISSFHIPHSFVFICVTTVGTFVVGYDMNLI